MKNNLGRIRTLVVKQSEKFLQDVMSDGQNKHDDPRHQLKQKHL